MDIEIDWKNVHSEENFYETFLPQVDAPDWHGHNLDALNDSLVTGDINGIEPPYRIVNKNTRELAEELVGFQRRVFSIISDAVIERDGCEVLLT